MILQFIFRRAVVFGYFFIAEAIINLAQLAQVVPAVHVEFTAVDKQSAFFAAAHHFGSQIVFLFRGVGKHSAVDNAVARKKAHVGVIVANHIGGVLPDV